MATRLTERYVGAVKLPTDKLTIHWDSEVRGFGVRVSPSGTKAFILNYRSAGRSRRVTIGRYPDWSVAAARDEAKVMKRAVDGGADPMADRHAARGAPTGQDLFDRYRTDHLPKKRARSAKDDQSMWENVILPRLGKVRLEDLTFTDVDKLHRDVTASGRPVRANRTVEVLRKGLNLAAKWDWVQKNVAVGVERNQEERRNRYLSQDEIARLCTAMVAHPQEQSVNAVRLLMLTGARRGEVLSATWDQFDLEEGTWTKPAANTKQKKEHRIPLSAPAMQLLAEMKGTSDATFLFPSAKDSERHQTDLKRTWKSLCTEAGLTEVVGHETNRKGERVPILRTTARLHDLRHTYASLLVSGGASLPLIGALLGHTQAQTTHRYAHLFDDPQRAATERVGAVVDAATNGGTAEIVPMAKGG